MPVPEIATDVQKTILEAIESGQKLVLDAVKGAGDVVRPVLPELPAIDGLPTPAEVIENGYDFAKKLLAVQQEFLTEAVAAFTPAAKA